MPSHYDIEPGRYGVQVYIDGQWEDYASIDSSEDLKKAKGLVRSGDTDSWSGKKYHYRIVELDLPTHFEGHVVEPSESLGLEQEIRQTGVHPDWKVKGGPDSEEIFRRLGYRG